jgi:hypothetical protein
MEVYKGIKGALNYKDKKMADSLRSAIDKKMQQDPSFVKQFVPATSREELRLLHNEYCTEDAVITEEYTNPKKEKGESSFAEDKKTNVAGDYKNTDGDYDGVSTKSNSSGQTSFIDEFDDEIADSYEADPLKTGNRIKRDYVIDEGYVENAIKDGVDEGRTSFGEPTSAEQAFEIKKPIGSGSPFTNDEKGQAKKKEEPFNPSFNDMDGSKKRKQSKRLAKTCVSGFCTLTEMGIVWYGNRNITEAKLAEYGISKEINLKILLDLGGEQKATVLEFFRSQRIELENIAKFDNEFKEELTDLLTELFIEKGIAPTTIQNIWLLLGEGVGIKKILPTFIHSSRMNDVLDQLRAMEQGGSENQYATSTDHTAPHETFADNAPPTPTAQATPSATVVNNNDFFDGDGGNTNFVEKGLSIIDSQK